MPPDPYSRVQNHVHPQWLEKQGVVWLDLYSSGHPRREKVQAGTAAAIEMPYHHTASCAYEVIAFVSEAREGPGPIRVNAFQPHPAGPFYSAPQEYLDRYDAANLSGPFFREGDLGSQARLRATNFQSTATLLEEFPPAGGSRHEWLGQSQWGVSSNALVELIDIALTRQDLTALEIPDSMQGQSLLPILIGTSTLERHRDFVRREYHDALKLPNTRDANVIFDGHQKLVLYHGTGEGGLFNLRADSHAFDNLWDRAETAEIK